MNIQEKLIKEYPLTTKVTCKLNCYFLAKRRYLIFWDGIVEKSNINQILNEVEEKCGNSSFSEWKTIIVVGNTNDEFETSELHYFNNVNTVVVFYLYNQGKNKIFKNNSWIFPLGLNYKKYVKKNDKVLS